MTGARSSSHQPSEEKGTMQDLVIRPRTPDDDIRIIEIRNALSPHLPPMSIERFRHYEEASTLHPQSLHERYVAERGGQIVGGFIVERMWWVDKPGGYWAHISIDRSHWHQGVGSRLYTALTERLAELDATRIYSQVREDIPESQRFAERRGFVTTGRSDRMSRLAVRSANLEGYEGVEERLARDGIRIVTLAQIGLDDDPFLHALHEVTDNSARDIPSSEKYTSSPYELWYRDEIEGPGKSPHSIFIAVDGNRPVGVAFMERDSDTTAGNDYTGVDRDYRGRGIARALKYRTIEWARANGIEYIYTGNDVDNQRMLAINIRLGYEPLPSSQEVVKHLTA